MKTISIKALIKIFGSIGTLAALAFLVSASPVFAHNSPAGCHGSGLSISLFVNPTQAHIGDTVSYSANVFNGIASGPIVCDASNIQASIITPDGVTHPLALIRTALSNTQQDSYTNVVSYTIRSSDPIGNLSATGHVVGDIHQNDTDSQGGADQQVNVQVLAAPTTQQVTPPSTPSTPTTPAPPSGGGPSVPGTSVGSGGSCAYGFNFALMRCNYTPLPSVAPVAAVIAPTLPHTGLSPEEASNFWINFARFFIFIIIPLSILCTRKPHSIGS